MKHLKQFETEVAYTQFKDTENYVLPNVSYVKDTKDVKYGRKKALILQAKYNATPDNLVAFTGAKNIKSMSVNGTSVEIEPINNETTTFDVLGENISVNMETGEGTFPESYLIKSPVSSWSFKAKDPNYVINENTYICMLDMFDGVTMADPIPFEDAIGYNFTTSDGVTIEASDTFLDRTNTYIQNGGLLGLTLVDIDWDNGTFAFTDTEHQTIVTTGGMPNYSFDNEGTYDVKIELADPTIRMKFTETPLVSIEIGNDITSIGASVFHNDDTNKSCTSLTSVTIGNSVTSIGYTAFENCSSLSSVTIPNSVTSIGENAFYGCSNLTSITIPNSVTEIGGNAFGYCTSLTSVTIGNSVTSIGYAAFSDCSSLTSITIPNSVTSIGGSAFSYCSKLTSINIPDGVTSIGGWAFRDCTGITSITIPNSVTSIGEYTFAGCSSLTNITIGNSVTVIDQFAFRDCTGITSIIIPDSVTSIGYMAFSGCSSLTSVTIGNSVTSIGEYAFENCSSLTNITIGNSVTEIKNGAFRDCTGITSIIIPDSVTNIEKTAFYNCNSLSSITCYAPIAPSIQSNSFYNPSNGGTLYVPTGSDYSSWMSTNFSYLGYNNWTIHYI